MKRHLSLLLLAFVVCLGATAQVKKTNLKVLYVGGHSDMETFGVAAYDTAANDRSIVERTAAWEKYLNDYFTTPQNILRKEYGSQYTSASRICQIEQKLKNVLQACPSLFWSRAL